MPAAFANSIAQCRQRRYTHVMTVNVEVINDGALNLLSEMEKLNLIRLNFPAATACCQESERPSERFAGALRLSDTAYEAFQKTLQDGRNEWARDIC